MLRAFLLASCGLIALNILGCRSRETQTTADSSFIVDSAPATATPPAGSSLTPTTLIDPQIVQIVIAANAADSAGGVMAQERARSAAVKEFAAMMVKDHAALNRQLTDAAKKLTLTPEETATSRQILRSADSALTAIAALTGAEFDRAYADREVQSHQTVLDQLDQTLIPGAQNVEVKTLLQTARPLVAAHLERAKQLQATVSARP
jgi:putative membrane protein